MPVAWPMAVYFDASALIQLPHDLANPDLLKLREAAAKVNAGLFMPEVAAEEWIYHHQELVTGEHARLTTASRTIGRYLQRDPLAIEKIQVEDIRVKVREAQLSHLIALGIEVISTPAVPLGQLIRMAIRREKPFEKEDKGFRDALITLTIEAHASIFPGQAILVIANDSVFRSDEVLSKWKQAGVDPTTARSVGEAVISFESKIDVAVKALLDEEEGRVISFLKQHQAEIFAYIVGKVEFSEFFLQGGFGLGAKSAPLLGTIKGVRRARPLEIVRASRAYGTDSRGIPMGRIAVTFDVKVAFDVVTSSLGLGDLIGPRFPLSEWGPESIREAPRSIMTPVESEHTIERDITISATVRQDEGGHLSDLQVERIHAY